MSFHDYEETNDFRSCEECFKQARELWPATHMIGEQDLCEYCYELAPKCTNCGTAEFDASNKWCAECILADELERAEETLLSCSEYLQNVDELWENIVNNK